MRPLLLALLLFEAVISTGKNYPQIESKQVVINVVDGCPEFAGKEGSTCSKVEVNSVGNEKEMYCKLDKMFTFVQPNNSEILFEEVSVKASCLSRCDPYFRRASEAYCPTGTENGCDKLTGDYSAGLTCKHDTATLFVNGVPIKKSAKCDSVKGWTDTGDSTAIIDFAKITGEPIFEYYCHENCHSSSFKNDCNGANCIQPLFDSNDKTLKCPVGSGSKLAYDGAFYDTAKCTREGWKGIKKSDPEKILLVFATGSYYKLQIGCQSSKCEESRIIHTCTTDLCRNPSYNSATNKLYCAPGYYLKIDKTNYKGEVTCSSDGWTHTDSTKKVIDYTDAPDQSIRAMCMPYCDMSMVEDACPPGVCTAKPKVENNKLTCEAGHYLLIDNVPRNELKCASGVWTALENPSNWRVDNSVNFDKIKAICFSKCHSDYILTDCIQPCSKPLYDVGEGKLLCRNPDDVLHFNGKITSSDINCDKTTGWNSAEGTILAFTDTVTTVTAFCKSASDTSKTAAKSSEEKQKGLGQTTLLAIVGSGSLVLGIGLGIGIGLLICRICTRKSGHSGSNKASFSKSGSKTKSGKKGKKGKKSKKSKKSKESKKENATVVMPGHQMSQFTSDNLTNVIAGKTPPNAKNVIIPPNTPEAQTPPIPMEAQTPPNASNVPTLPIPNPMNVQTQIA